MRFINTYKDTLISKNKLKKLLLLRFLLHRDCMGLVAIKVNEGQKNIFLDSPFHFKTAKTHLNIPSIEYQITTNSKLSCLSFIGLQVKIDKFKPIMYKL